MILRVINFSLKDYDDTSSIWSDNWYKDTTMLPFLKECKKLLKDNSKVLDLGCNCGYETRSKR